MDCYHRLHVQVPRGPAPREPLQAPADHRGPGGVLPEHVCLEWPARPLPWPLCILWSAEVKYFCSCSHHIFYAQGLACWLRIRRIVVGSLPTRIWRLRGRIRNRFREDTVPYRYDFTSSSASEPANSNYGWKIWTAIGRHPAIWHSGTPFADKRNRKDHPL